MSSTESDFSTNISESSAHSLATKSNSMRTSDGDTSSGESVCNVASHSVAYDDEPLAKSGKNEDTTPDDPDGIVASTLEQRGEGRIPLDQWKGLKLDGVLDYKLGILKSNTPLNRGIRVNTMPRGNDSRYEVPRAWYPLKNIIITCYKPSSLIGQTCSEAVNGGSNTSGEELYPAAVFQRENSDSAKKRKKSRNIKSVAKRVLTKKTRKPVNSDKFYSTVWLSDYESWDMKSETGDPSTGVNSRVTTPYSSRPTTPFDSKGSSPLSSPPSSPFVARENYNGDDVCDSGNPSEAGRLHDAIQKPKPVKLTRTLSLPESELSQIEANDLQQRFTTLQLEQENRELKQLTDDLQDALENLEKRVRSVSDSDQQHDGKTCDGRTPPYSSDDVFADDRALPQSATSEPSSPSSLSSHDTFVHSPKLSKPNSLDLSGSGARKRKHTEKMNASNSKNRKAAKHKEDSICCITS